MMNDNKEKDRSQAPNQTTGADQEKASSRAAAHTSGWRKLMTRKWVFPATYMTAAAIILAMMWVIQNSGTTGTEADLTALEDDPALEQQQDGELEDALPVQGSAELMNWPVESRDEVDVIMPFFEAGASEDEKQAALMEHDDTYIPNTGIALARQDDETFNVIAALSGEVTRAENVPLVGNLVEITHEDDMVTIYYSLTEVAVQRGDIVQQGDVIAKAGRNELEKNLGVHLHFEVHRSGEPVNPEAVIAQEMN